MTLPPDKLLIISCLCPPAIKHGNGKSPTHAHLSGKSSIFQPAMLDYHMVSFTFMIPLWCTQMGLNPWKIKWNQGHPGYWPPKCKNEIRGVQPHMLRKEKIISHPTEGFAKIKSRGSRNKIKKVPSQHPKCSRNKTEGFKVSLCVCEIIWNFNNIYQILNPNISKPSF